MVFRILTKLYKRIRNAGSPPFIIMDSHLEGNNRFGANTVIVRSSVGKYTYCGSGCNFYDTSIGSFCCIGNNVKVIAAQHPTDFISVHPFFYGKSYGNVTENTFKDFKLIDNTKSDHYPPPAVGGTEEQCARKDLRAIIKHDVWIGDNVLISGGVCIGTGAIIGMGAVVTKDVPPYAIVGGVPAKIIRYRFSEPLIENLLSSRWWLYPEEILKQNISLAAHPADFIQKITKSKYTPGDAIQYNNSDI